MDNTRTVTDAKQQKIKIKKDVITSSMSTIVDRTCYVFFLSGFPTKTLYTPLLSPIRAACPIQLIFLDFITRIILREHQAEVLYMTKLITLIAVFPTRLKINLLPHRKHIPSPI
jgi:hypothetical protein